MARTVFYSPLGVLNCQVPQYRVCKAPCLICVQDFCSVYQSVSLQCHHWVYQNVITVCLYQTAQDYYQSVMEHLGSIWKIILSTIAMMYLNARTFQILYFYHITLLLVPTILHQLISQSSHFIIFFLSIMVNRVP